MNKGRRKDFNIGMFTMFLASVGSHLFNKGSWMTYLALLLMLLSLATVWKYIYKN